jgi:hypothetical protein
MAWKAIAHGPWNDIGAWRRGLVAGTVAALHLALLLMLLRPATPLFVRRGRPTPALDAIRVRLLSTKPPPARPPVPDMPRARARHAVIAAAHARHLLPVGAQSTAPPPRPLDLTLPPRTATSSGTVPPYIPGGQGFGRPGDDDARRRPRLPGMWGARTSHYRMRDPRRHGIAGFAHLLQRALGVTSRQCLWLEHLKTLSKAQLAARGLLKDDLPALAVKYGCR